MEARPARHGGKTQPVTPQSARRCASEEGVPRRPRPCCGRRVWGAAARISLPGPAQVGRRACGLRPPDGARWRGMRRGQPVAVDNDRLKKRDCSIGPTVVVGSVVHQNTCAWLPIGTAFDQLHIVVVGCTSDYCIFLSLDRGRSTRAESNIRLHDLLRSSQVPNYVIGCCVSQWYQERGRRWRGEMSTLATFPCRTRS